MINLNLEFKEVVSHYLDITNSTRLKAMFERMGEIIKENPTVNYVSFSSRMNWNHLGRLSFKEEAAGKLRVFAMVDVFTQSMLKPLHD